MKTLLSKRVLILSGLAVVGLFLIRPQAGRLRWRVVGSISKALSRHVQVGSVHVRFLPQPGFELDDVVIPDDPSFGAEPLLRSPEVIAAVRVAPLFHGRIEISSLSLSEASLNLTRNPQDRWNLEDLLQRAASTATAPTASGKSSSRSQFPYIEATQARINFKIGTEKTHFAFTNAEFALWQDSENTWSMRLKAQPIRTDASLTDTGLVNISGKWQRSTVLHETPVQFSFEWKQAQIGQVSKLIYGRDQGWRGNALVSGTLMGSPAHLMIATEATIADFRRQDIGSGENLRLAAHCSADYGSIQNTLSDLDCSAPVGEGSLELKGSASGPRFSSYGLSLVASQVPLQNMLSAARQVDVNVPDGLQASGILNGRLAFSRGDAVQPVQWSGDGELQELALSSGGAASAMLMGRVPLSLKSETSKPRKRALQQSPQLEIGPVSVAMGSATPLKAHALLSVAGYEASVRGDASLKRLLPAARMLGLPAPAVTAEGSSTVDLTIARSWATSGQVPSVTGTVQLRSVHTLITGLNEPLQIVSANLLLDHDSVRVQNLTASTAEAAWHGWLLVPRPCGSPADCRVQFDLRAAEVSATELNNLLNPTAVKRPWYKFLSSSDTQTSYLLQAQARGKFVVDKLRLGTSVWTHVTADATLDAGNLAITSWDAEFLGGGARGNWTADFTAKPPAYSGSGTFDNASLAEIAGLMKDRWIGGKGSAKYQFKASGGTIQDVLAAADVRADFAIRDSDFPHIVLPGTSGPLRASVFSGRILLREGKFAFEDAKLESAAGVYKISGTVSVTGSLNLKIAGESTAGYVLSGTLARTRVSQVRSAATQVALKP